MIESKVAIPRHIHFILRREHLITVTILLTFFAAAIAFSLAFGIYQRNEMLCDAFDSRATLMDEFVARELMIGSESTISFELTRLQKQLDLSSIKLVKTSLVSEPKCSIGLNGFEAKHSVHLGDDPVATVVASRRTPIEFGFLGVGFAVPFAFIFAVTALLFYRFSSRVRDLIVSPIQALSNAVRLIRFDDELDMVQTTSELEHLRNAINELLIKTKSNAATISALESSSKLANAAKQVAHDIRSPLTSLNLASGNLVGVEEETRRLIKNAVSRINDIANDLYTQGRFENLTVGSDSSSCVSIANLVDTLVSEKRIQFRQFAEIQVSVSLSQSYGAFINSNVKELSRAISNLIDNAVEACGTKGTIEVIVESLGESAKVTVKDSGCGIPESILPNLGKKGFSFGKHSATSGSGLGLWHAKKFLAQSGGKLHLNSGTFGSEIAMELPKVHPPSWFVVSLDLTEIDDICVLDDDTSIHNVWQKRFGGIEKTISGFTSASEFKKWFYQSDTKRTLFLVDYELLNQGLNGIDVIEQLGIQSQSILVASHCDDPDVLKRCLRINQKMLPKAMAIHVPICSGAGESRKLL